MPDFGHVVTGDLLRPADNYSLSASDAEEVLSARVVTFSRAHGVVVVLRNYRRDGKIQTGNWKTRATDFCVGTC